MTIQVENVNPKKQKEKSMRSTNRPPFRPIESKKSSSILSYAEQRRLELAKIPSRDDFAGQSHGVGTKQDKRIHGRFRNRHCNHA